MDQSEIIDHAAQRATDQKREPPKPRLNMFIGLFGVLVLALNGFALWWWG